MSARDRIYERKFRALMRTFNKYPRRRIASWWPSEHRVFIGSADMSKTPAARKMNCLIRLKLNRESL
jgi:hypothetical protein